MNKEIKDITSKISDKCLLGIITLDTLLGNPLIASARGLYEKTKSQNFNDYHTQYAMFITGMCVTALGSAFSLAADTKKKKYIAGITLGVGIGTTLTSFLTGLYEIFTK